MQKVVKDVKLKRLKRRFQLRGQLAFATRRRSVHNLLSFIVFLDVIATLNISEAQNIRWYNINEGIHMILKNELEKLITLPYVASKDIQ